MPHPCIHTEGGLIPADLIEQIAAGEASGQSAADFGLPRQARLTDEIAAAWADARIYWDAFQRGLGRLPEDDPATTVTREQWVLPLLRALGYNTITFMSRAAVIGTSTYAISHRAAADESGPPVHVAGCRADMDRRPPTGRPRLSPHALMQEYLNRSEHLWGVVTNGRQLRLLRDSALMTRPSYVEFDLEQMLDGEHFADFAMLYRLVHRSRLPQTWDDAAECQLEAYFQQAMEQGGRVRDRLRDGVEEALEIFGSGFLSHPASQPLRHKVGAGNLSPTAYYRQLLRLVYRLLFLMVCEERHLIGPEDPGQANIYQGYYSVSRLRDSVEGYAAADERHADLWQGLCHTFRLFEDDEVSQRLGMHALDADLFGPRAIPDLEGAQLTNADFRRALRRLSLYRDPKERITRRVNYAALDVEELGSVYESLLEYHPVVDEEDGQLAFAFALGSERKTTGSYYTRPELVQELIKSALEPVLEERLKEARNGKSGVANGESEAILSIKVLDPACGSGHFLLAAARRLGRELARVRTGEEHPTPAAFREAVRQVIQRCIYGVDKNPLAVDLCKVALWLEGHNPGMPLTFLDHRIKCGDSLVGVFDLRALAGGIPDDAYKPVTGDDRKLATGLRKRNKQEREGQLGLSAPTTPLDVAPLAALCHGLSRTPDDAVAAVRHKQQTYEGARAHGSDWWTLWTACNLWTAAFFLPLTASAPGGEGHIPTTDAIRRYLANPAAADAQMVAAANAMAAEHPFFHWPLEFPDVFFPSPVTDGEPVPSEAEGLGTGFDVVLSNPPWERIKLQEKEFFASHDVEIATAPNKAARDRLIKSLPRRSPALARQFQQAKHQAEASSKFVRTGDRFPLTGVGDINTYTVFTELARQLLGDWGRAGIICPPGIASDDTTKEFFADLMETQSLVSLIAFVNEKFIFPAVLHNFRFCALTLAGSMWQVEQADFAYECQTFEDIGQQERHFTLSTEDLALLNPNTRTAPVFRSRVDAELTKEIYRRVPVLMNETTGENPWGVRFLAMFHMANDSHLFRTREQLQAVPSHSPGNRLVHGKDVWLPLYEGKMIHQFDHRYASFEKCGGKRLHMLPETGLEQHRAPDYHVLPYYYVAASEVEERLRDRWDKGWLLGFRGITSKALVRTAMFGLLPLVGVGHSMPLLFAEGVDWPCVAGLVLAGNMNTIAFDYTVRQKLGGVNLTYGYLRQLPVLPPDAYTDAGLSLIVPRVLELVYTAWDVKPFTDDLWGEAAPSPGVEGGESLRAALKAQWQANAAATGGHMGAQPPEWLHLICPSPAAAGEGQGGEGGFPYPPFKWDDERRAVLRAELDAYYARLYGLTEEELRYILDPADVYGPDFPGETFRVLKEKEIKQYGEYRTRRLVLEAWEGLDG